MFNERGELLDVYRSTPLTLEKLLRGLPDRVLRAAGDAKDEWSIVEVVCHLRDAEERSLARVRRMIKEHRPRLEAYDPAELARAGRYREQSFAAALTAFVDRRVEHTALLESAGESEWAREGMHEEVGEISVQQLTAHMAAHDAIHLAQIARLIRRVG